MTDITKCLGTGCPLRESCWRYKAPDEQWQSFSDFSPHLKMDESRQISCDYFLERRDVQMKKVEIVCNFCGNNLNQESSMPGYRLCLTAEPTPTGNVVYSVMIYPPIESPHHFCGTGCLRKWIDPT